MKIIISEEAVEFFCESNDLDMDTIIPRLIEILSTSKDKNAQEHATNILSCLREPKAIPFLIEILQQRDNTNTRLYAIRVLGTTIRYAEKEDYQIAVPALLKALDDGDYRIRTWAVNSLGNIGESEAAIPLLIKRLTDESSYVRGSSAEALGKIWQYSNVIERKEQIVNSLIENLNDNDEFVREKIIQALKMIGDPVAIPYLKKIATEDPYLKEIRSTIAESSGFDKQRDGTYFIYQVRRAAKEALEEIEDKSRTNTPSSESLTEPLSETVVPATPTSEPTITSQMQPEPQASSESTSMVRLKDATIIAILILVVIIVIGSVVYLRFTQRDKNGNRNNDRY